MKVDLEPIKAKYQPTEEDLRECVLFGENLPKEYNKNIIIKVL